MAALTFAVNVNAAIVFQESFDYTSGNDTHITEGSWVGSGSAPYGSVGTGRFTTSNLNPFGVTGGSLWTFSGDESTVAVSGTTALDTTYYFSFMFEANGSSNQISSIEFNSAFGRTFDVGVLDGSFGVGTNVGSFSATTSIGNNSEFFVVGILRVNDDGFGTNDDSFILGANLFTSASDVADFVATNPGISGADWSHYQAGDVASTGNLTYTFDSISLDTNGISSYFDEIRIGTDLASVAVPEPSTYALFSGFAVLGLMLWRRRRL